MSELALALRMELFKARRLKLMWALLLVMVVFLALNSGVSYQAYRDVQRFAGIESRSSDPDDRAGVAMHQEMVAMALRANLVLPSAYAGVTGVLYFPGFVLITIAAASLVANEFGWGTMQRLLARGRRRPVALAAKLGMVGALGAIGVAVGLAVGTAAGFATSQGLHAWRPEAFDAETWRSLGTMAARLWAVLVVYGLLAAAAGFLFHSTGLAVGGALVYYFVEALVSGLIVQSRGWLPAIRPYFLGNVAHALVVEHNPFVAALMGGGPWMEQAGARLLDPATAWLALGAWAVVFVAACAAAFQGRDLAV